MGSEKKENTNFKKRMVETRGGGLLILGVGTRKKRGVLKEGRVRERERLGTASFQEEKLLGRKRIKRRRLTKKNKRRKPGGHV